MPAIIYDLETSDRFNIGQILNYCFTLVDDNLEPLATLSDIVRVSPLQLPAPEAILTNRINILEHQSRAQDGEYAAAEKIHNFISQAVESSRQPVVFAGFNSSRFDLGFLRTTLIRNGFDPYFSSKLVHRDVLHLVRKVALTDRSFPRPIVEDPVTGQQRVSLALEPVSRTLELLDGRQQHEASSDVELTLRLLRCLRDRYRANLFSFDPYEARALHRGVRSGQVVFMLETDMLSGVSGPLAVSLPMTLLDCDYRYALWISLERFKDGEGRGSIRWFNQATHALFVDRPLEPEESGEWAPVAKRALDNLSGINLKNFFEKSSCDIEQDIYRLDQDQRVLLSRAIRHGSGGRPKFDSRDAEVLYLRYQLNNYNWDSAADRAAQSALRKYALYRYGGKARMDKFSRTDHDTTDGQGTCAGEFHPALTSWLRRIDEVSKHGSPEDSVLMDSLLRFYLESPIGQVARNELLRDINILA